MTGKDQDMTEKKLSEHQSAGTAASIAKYTRAWLTVTKNDASVEGATRHHGSAVLLEEGSEYMKQALEEGQPDHCLQIERSERCRSEERTLCYSALRLGYTFGEEKQQRNKFENHEPEQEVV
jgi:hypothetical protein